MQRYKVLPFTNRGGDCDAKMVPDNDGPWVRHEQTLVDPQEFAPDANSICIVFWSDENEAWIAQAGEHEMQGLSAHGDTPQEAVSQFWIARVAFVETVLHAEG
jgi:hypothetical protein